MATQKQQLISQITNLIEEFNPKLSFKDVSFLEAQNLSWLTDYREQVHAATSEQRKDRQAKRLLETALAEIRQEVSRKNAEQDTAQQAENTKFYRDMALFRIGKVVINGRRVVVNEASSRLLESWVNPGEAMSASWFLKIMTEQPELANQLPWVSASFDQNAADRDTFNRCASLYGYSPNQANFGLLHDALGAGFSQYDIETATSTNHVSLAPPTKDELSRWNLEDIEQHNQALLNASTTELKKIAKQESEQNRADEQIKQAQAHLDLQQQRESTMGFPAMPSDITRKRILAATPSEIKYWSRRYGRFQLNRTLAGLQEN
jgi:hypothetical protein